MYNLISFLAVLDYIVVMIWNNFQRDFISRGYKSLNSFLNSPNHFFLRLLYVFLKILTYTMCGFGKINTIDFNDFVSNFNQTRLQKNIIANFLFLFYLLASRELLD